MLRKACALQLDTTALSSYQRQLFYLLQSPELSQHLNKVRYFVTPIFVHQEPLPEFLPPQGLYTHPLNALFNCCTLLCWLCYSRFFTVSWFQSILNQGVLLVKGWYVFKKNCIYNVFSYHLEWNFWHVGREMVPWHFAFMCMHYIYQQ